MGKVQSGQTPRRRKTQGNADQERAKVFLLSSKILSKILPLSHSPCLPISLSLSSYYPQVTLSVLYLKEKAIKSKLNYYLTIKSHDRRNHKTRKKS